MDRPSKASDTKCSSNWFTEQYGIPSISMNHLTGKDLRPQYRRPMHTSNGCLRTKSLLCESSSVHLVGGTIGNTLAAPASPTEHGNGCLSLALDLSRSGLSARCRPKYGWASAFPTGPGDSRADNRRRGKRAKSHISRLTRRLIRSALGAPNF